MRAAPPVRVVCRPDPLWRTFEATITGAAAAVGCGWAAWWLGAGATVVLALAAAGCVPVAAWLQARASPTSDLAWAGDGWLLDGQPGRPQLRIDLGDWLLLSFRFDDGARTRWIPVGRAFAPGQRHLLRVALHLPTTPWPASAPVPRDG